MPSGSPLTWPLRRVLDPRFGDVSHRVSGVAQEIHELRTQVGALHGALDGHAEAVVELATHVGERMDAIEGALERIERRLAELSPS